MSLTRASSSALSAVRSLARFSAPKSSKVCFECLVHPASCQISSIAAAASGSSSGYGVASARWQSTSSVSTTAPEASSSVPPLTPATGTAEQQARPDEEVATSTPGQKDLDNTLPTLDDLQALKNRKIPVPDESESASSPEVGMYARRFKRLASRVGKAFNKDQIVYLLRLAGFKDVDANNRKIDLIKRIMTEYWHLMDPAEYAIREAERKKQENHIIKDVIEDVPVTEKELFFLLEKGTNANLLFRLGHKNRVKVAIRSGSLSTLQIKGPPRLVKEVKKEWDRLSRDIKIEILDTKLSEPLRPDLYRSLSLATDAYIAPNEKRGKQIQVSHRSEQSVPVRRAEAGLRQLRLQSSILSDAPRFGLFDAQNDDNVYLPIVPQNPVPWDLQTTPPLSITRYTSMTPASGPRPLYKSESVDVETNLKEFQDALFDPLVAASGDLKVKASFGHLIRLNTEGPSKLVGPYKLSEWSGQPDNMFLPATPDGIANRYALKLRRYESRYLEEHTQNLKLTTRQIRRVLYTLDDNVSLPLKYLQFERPWSSQRGPGWSAQASSPDESPQGWIGEHGQRSFVHICIPHSLNDLRLEASKSEIIPSDTIESFALGVGHTPPTSLTWNNQTYSIAEDYRIRESVFESGVPDPFASSIDKLQPVMERRLDHTFPTIRRTTAFDLRSDKPEKAVGAVLRMLQEL